MLLLAHTVPYLLSPDAPLSPKVAECIKSKLFCLSSRRDLLFQALKAGTPMNKFIGVERRTLYQPRQRPRSFDRIRKKGLKARSIKPFRANGSRLGAKTKDLFSYAHGETIDRALSHIPPIAISPQRTKFAGDPICDGWGTQSMGRTAKSDPAIPTRQSLQSHRLLRSRALVRP
jgi:hypothetical protein